jgi:2-keto-4-pentenoate hydratase/2-oxohepta-3-ene-1,7-dioic acid hydratase in catechol pathway
VLAASGGVPNLVALLPTGARDDLASALELAQGPVPDDAQLFTISPAEAAQRICSPVPVSQPEIDSERLVIVAAGLNYAAHAEEAGGGDVFLFPKPSAPTPPYGSVSPPPGVTLLDYEVELGLVLLADVSLAAPPSWPELLARSAFFVANDVTDREPIIVQSKLVGDVPSLGFVDAKGQPGFLPAGPWLVRGTELFAAVEACGGGGLPIRLEVDDGEGFVSRQDANTEKMMLDPLELIAKIGDDVRASGLRTDMPAVRGGVTRHYPMAVDEASPRLPAGSVLLTGTPEGVALATPDPLGLVARGALRLRGPFEQFRQEQLARAAAREPGGYLAPGHRIRARIAGLGTQIVQIAEPGRAPADPCARP